MHESDREALYRQVFYLHRAHIMAKEQAGEPTEYSYVIEGNVCWGMLQPGLWPELARCAKCSAYYDWFRALSPEWREKVLGWAKSRKLEMTQVSDLPTAAPGQT